MRNKLLLSGLGVCLATSLNATSLFTNSGNDYMDDFNNDIINFLKNDRFFNKALNHYKIDLSKNYPKMNVFENDKNYIFKFELAGIDKKDIKVTITDKNILSVVGTKKKLSKEEKKNIIREEQSYGTISRKISLPDDIDSNKIDVSYKNGILKVVVPRDMKKKDKKVKTLFIK